MRKLEYADSGVHLSDCGNNIFTFGEGKTCANGDRHYIDPETGVLYHGAVGSNTKPPVTWNVATSAILAAESASLYPSSDATTLATSNPTATYHTHEAPSSGLSTAACAGIAVAVAIAVTAICILAWLSFRERRKRRMLQSEKYTPMYPAPKTIYASELPPQELEDKARNEAP